MKKIFFLLFTGVLIVSCNGNDPAHANQTDTTHTDTNTLESIQYFQADLDGAFDEFYMYSAKGDTVFPTTTEIRIVPSIMADYPDDSSVLYDYMQAISQNDFAVNSHFIFQNYTGKFSVYYDANCTNLVTEFQVVNGAIDGPVKLYSKDGELLIDRNYINGTCVKTTLDIYAIDWIFNPSTADLTIQQLDLYTSIDTNGNPIIELGESMNASTGQFVNQLSALIEKPVFENDFKVNGEPFTGRIVAYPIYAGTDSTVYYDLSLENGKLHGCFYLYSEWGELQLQELFDHGVFVETLYELDYSEMDGVAKPIIYLYPEKTCEINVALDFKGKLTHSYPKYPAGGWNVTAQPDGTLTTADHREFYALFWEGNATENFTYKNGHVVAGNQTEKFLEASLAILGLNRREANEFIMYWLPQMEHNAYNLIHFSSNEYEEMAKLKITPEPETVIRVMMVWSPLDHAIEFPQQDLYELKKERSGFTAVEWGGKKQEYKQEMNFP